MKLLCLEEILAVSGAGCLCKCEPNSGYHNDSPGLAQSIGECYNICNKSSVGMLECAQTTTPIFDNIIIEVLCTGAAFSAGYMLGAFFFPRYIHHHHYHRKNVKKD